MNEHARTRRESMRVVIIGDAGLDASVREDAQIETVRPRTPLEAVGELASPPASARDRRTVVVIGHDGEPERERDAFVRALRLADPDAKLVRVSTNGAGPAHVEAGYDAVLRGPATGEALRRVLGSASEQSGEESGVRFVGAGSAGDLLGPMDLPGGHPSAAEPSDGREEPPLVVSRRGVTAGARSGGVGDAVLLGVLNGSRDAFVQEAMGLIRARTGRGGLRFVAQRGTEEAAEAGVAVERSGRVHGWLVPGEGCTAEGLGSHAAWLASWLEHHDRQRSLRRAAFSDPLTGAWNRRYFDGFLNAALDRARAARRTVTVLVFDIDGFKKYNDLYGHPAGDEILIETVRALKSSVRPSDRVCRIGGDEFAVVFDEPEGPRQTGSRPPESVYALAKRVQRRIGEKEFPKLGADARGVLTISGGLAAFPWDGHDAETLLARADELACQSKRQGKNAITLGPGAARVCKYPGDEATE